MNYNSKIRSRFHFTMKHCASTFRILAAVFAGLLLKVELHASSPWVYSKAPPAYPLNYNNQAYPDIDANGAMPAITPLLVPYTLQTTSGLLVPGGTPVVNNFTLTKRTNVLVRGLGPSAGGTWNLGSPTLTLLHQKTDGTWETLGTNSNWVTAVTQVGGPVVLENIMSRVNASTLSRTSGDAAIYMQLPAGTYQAQLKATGGDGVLYVNLLQPGGVTASADGSVYVSDHGSLWKLAGGTATQLVGSSTFGQSGGMVADSSGTFYVADSTDSVIWKVTSTGTVTVLAGQVSSTGFRDGLGSVARFNAPRGITIDGSGNLYIADTGNMAIRKVDQTGNVTTLSLTEGSDNNPPTPVTPTPTPSGGGGGGGGATSPLYAGLLLLLSFVRLFTRRVNVERSAS